MFRLSNCEVAAKDKPLPVGRTSGGPGTEVCRPAGPHMSGNLDPTTPAELERGRPGSPSLPRAPSMAVEIAGSPRAEWGSQERAQSEVAYRGLGVRMVVATGRAEKVTFHGLSRRIEYGGQVRLPPSTAHAVALQLWQPWLLPASRHATAHSPADCPPGTVSWSFSRGVPCHLDRFGTEPDPPSLASWLRTTGCLQCRW